MEIILEITIPEKVSLNKIYAGMHWRKRQELADIYHSEFLGIKVPPISESEYPVRIRYDFHFVSKPLDTLNCGMMAKMLEDGLVAAKVLKDDATEYVREAVIVSRKSSDYKHDTCVLTICSLR